MSLPKAEFNAFCATLPSTTFVEQWGGAQVWKVGGKVFAIAWFEAGQQPEITFKVSDIGWEVLRGAAGCRPAPYMASRGLKWIQSFAKPGLSKRELKAYLQASYKMVAMALPKRKRLALGLTETADG
ncbi:MAG: MmcQ/YjbR family DNA-binding protein [Hyphomonadaceae bacterium]